MEPHARKLEQAVEFSLSEFMTDRRLFEFAVDRIVPPEPIDEESKAIRDELGRAIHYLRDHWFCLSETTRSHMNQYFRDVDSEEKTEGEEEKK